MTKREAKVSIGSTQLIYARIASYPSIELCRICSEGDGIHCMHESMRQFFLRRLKSNNNKRILFLWRWKWCVGLVALASLCVCACVRMEDINGSFRFLQPPLPHYCPWIVCCKNQMRALSARKPDWREKIMRCHCDAVNTQSFLTEFYSHFRSNELTHICARINAWNLSGAHLWLFDANSMKSRLIFSICENNNIHQMCNGYLCRSWNFYRDQFIDTDCSGVGSGGGKRSKLTVTPSPLRHIKSNEFVTIFISHEKSISFLWRWCRDVAAMAEGNACNGFRTILFLFARNIERCDTHWLRCSSRPTAPFSSLFASCSYSVCNSILTKYTQRKIVCGNGT